MATSLTAPSPRIKGKALRLTIDSADYWADIISCVLNNEAADSDALTFGDVLAGGARTYFFELTAIQSTASGSFWRTVWDNAGKSAAFAYAPHGNETPTVDKPHYVGTLTIGAKPSLGGQAGSTSTYTFETRFDIDGEPAVDDGTGAGG